MANTYIYISSVTVGSGGASSIDFTSIPSTYTDLKLVASVRSTNAQVYSVLKTTFNGSTSGYSYKIFEGNGSSASTGNNSSLTYFPWNEGTGASATANTFGNAELYIPNYAGSTNKSLSSDGVSETNATLAYIDLIAGNWSNTAAITSISFIPDAGNWVQYSTVYLYGIKNS